MSRKVLFYTDPVAAMWMVRAYRLRLSAGAFCVQSESLDAFLEVLARGVRPERLVVSPDCVSVFDPRVGDVVEETVNGKVRVKRLAAKDFPLAGTACEILHRAGRPFFPAQQANE